MSFLIMLMALLLGGVSCSKIDDTMKVVEQRSICFPVNDVILAGASNNYPFSFDLPTNATNAKIIGFTCGGVVVDDVLGTHISPSSVGLHIRLTSVDAEKVGSLGLGNDLRLYMPIGTDANGLNIPIRGNIQYDGFCSNYTGVDISLYFHAWLKVEYELV